MIEVNGDLWKLSPEPAPCLRLITTNGETRKDGAAVMGRGCARQAKELVPGIDYKLGALLGRHGNRPMRLAALADGSHLGSFPVKHSWREAADPQLIERSAHQLVELADDFGYRRIFLPRPGCGNGALEWPDVRRILEEVLADERFCVITYP